MPGKENSRRSGAPSGRSRRLPSTSRPPGLHPTFTECEALSVGRTAYSRRLILHGREEALSNPGGSRGMPRRGIAAHNSGNAFPAVSKCRASLLIVLLFLFASGCAADFKSLRTGLEARGHYIEGVPFFRQEEKLCGPAALAAVASFWGRPASPERITACVYNKRLRGTLPMDMERYLRDTGFATTSLAGTLTVLKEHVRQGEPAICLLDLGFGPYRKPHYVTVIGFDDERRLVVFHDGVIENKVVAYDRFMEKWRRAGYWMLVARPETAGGKEAP